MKLTFRPKNGIDGSASVGNFKDLLKPLSDGAKVTFENGGMVIDDPLYSSPDDYLASLISNPTVNAEDYYGSFDTEEDLHDCESCDGDCADNIEPCVSVVNMNPALDDFVKRFTDEQIIDENGVDRNRAVLGINNEVIIHNQNREDNPYDVPYEIKDMLPQVRYMNNVMANTIADYAFAAAKQLFEYNTQMVTNMITESRKASRQEMCHVVDKAVESVTEDLCDEIDMTRDMIKQQMPKKKRK